MVIVLSLLALPVEVLNAIYWQIRTKAHNYTENVDFERHMPVTKLSLIHSPVRKSQSVRNVKGKLFLIASVSFGRALAFCSSVIALKTFYALLPLSISITLGVRSAFLIYSFLRGTEKVKGNSVALFGFYAMPIYLKI